MFAPFDGPFLRSEAALTTSVLICTHNRCALLEKTLRSLRQMEVPEELRWEVIVVDNNSSDGTAGMVAELSRQDPSFPLRYVAEARQGIALARNAGVESARGDIIAFVDDDVLVGSSWLSVIAFAFEADPTLAVLGGRLLANPESPMPAWIADVNPAPLGLVDFGDSRRVLTIPYLATANCAFRRSAILEAGMFDVRLGRQPDKLYADEDTDMVLKIQRAGGCVVYEPAMTALHFVPNHRMTKAYFRRWYFEKGEGSGLVGTGQRRALFGIAFHDYRHVTVALARYARGLVSGKPVFQQELAIRYFVGVANGRIKSWSRRF